MQNLLFFLMLNISPATQSDQLFVASDSLFNNHVYKFYNQATNN
jgi:hypothetical protein